MFQHGQFIRLKHQPTQTELPSSLTFQVEHHPAGNHRFFFRDTSGGGNLRILPNGQVDLKGGTGPWATFTSLQNPSDPSHFLLACVGHSSSQNNNNTIGARNSSGAATSERFLAFTTSSSSPSSNVISNNHNHNRSSLSSSVPWLSSSTDPSSPAVRWTFTPVTSENFTQHHEMKRKAEEAKSKFSAAQQQQLASIKKIELVNSEAPTKAVEIVDENLYVDVEDEDTVQLVSLASGLALPFPITIEVCSQKHCHVLAEQLSQQPNNNINKETFFNGKKIVNLLAHDKQSNNNGKDEKNNNANDVQNSHLRPVGAQFGHFDTNGGKGVFASFEVIKTHSGLLFQTLLVHPATSAASQRCYLAADPSAKILSLSTDTTNNENVFWMLRKVKRPLTSHQQHFLVPKIFDDVDFTAEQKRSFRENGFVIIKNAIQDPSLIESGLRFLNHTLGQGPKAWKFDEEQQKHVLVGGTHHTMLGLYRVSKIHTLLQRMLGRSNVDPVNNVQLALRFPVVDEFEEEDGVNLSADAQNQSQDNWHIDGHNKSTGNVLPFSVLVKVALSDQSKEGCGNFTVFPGTHRRRDVIEWYHSSVLQQQQQQRPSTTTNRPSLHDVRPLQVCMSPGDCVFVHPYLCHRVGSNVSQNVRYSTIVRIHAKNMEDVKRDRQKLVDDPLHWYF